LSRVKHVIFILGGVLIPTVTQATLALLNPEQQVDAGLQLVLYGLEKALTTGAISPQEYCRRVIQQTGAANNVAELLTGVPENTAALPQMLPLMEELSERASLGLVSDYPVQWARPIIKRTGLAAHIPGGINQVIGELRKNLDYATLFRQLIELNVLKPGSSMWVDHNSLRCMAAVRQGVDAGIFMDARRLYRDLGLWGMLPFRNWQKS